MQGITGKEGSFQTQRCIEYGTKVVAGVTPGRGGEKTEHGVPVFNTVSQAVSRDRRRLRPDLRAAAVRRRRHPRGADAGVPLVICITEGIPTLDMVKVKRALTGGADARSSARTAPA